MFIPIEVRFPHYGFHKVHKTYRLETSGFLSQWIGPLTKQRRVVNSNPIVVAFVSFYLFLFCFVGNTTNLAVLLHLKTFEVW